VGAGVLDPGPAVKKHETARRRQTRKVRRRGDAPTHPEPSSFGDEPDEVRVTVFPDDVEDVRDGAAVGSGRRNELHAERREVERGARNDRGIEQAPVEHFGCAGARAHEERARARAYDVGLEVDAAYLAIPTAAGFDGGWRGSEDGRCRHMRGLLE